MQLIMLYHFLLWSFYFNSKSPSSVSCTMVMLTTNSQLFIIQEFLFLVSEEQFGGAQNSFFFFLLSFSQHVITILLISLLSGEFTMWRLFPSCFKGLFWDVIPACSKSYQKTLCCPPPGKVSPCVVPAEPNFTQEDWLPLLLIFWLVTISKLCKMDHRSVQLCSRRVQAILQISL